MEADKLFPLPSSILWIVEITSSSDRIHDQALIFTTTSNEDVNAGDVISNKPKLRSISLLENKQRPEGLHEDGDRHDHLNSNEYPSEREGVAIFVLC
jgi:hypothetical protein